MKPIIVAVCGCLALVGCTDSQSAAENSTTELMLDTMGTKGFAVRRTMHGRDAASPDPIIVARNHLNAQNGLCPGRFTVMAFTVRDLPPSLIYEAQIRCL